MTRHTNKLYNKNVFQSNHQQVFVTFARQIICAFKQNMPMKNVLLLRNNVVM